MSDTFVVYKGRNAPFKARITDFDGSDYTDARMTAISRMELRYRPTDGATVEPVDSNNLDQRTCFDWATYAAEADVVIAIGLLDLTVGRDQTAELVVYDTTYPQGRVVGTLDIEVTAEAQGAGPLISILYPPLTVENDYPVVAADLSRPSIRVNAATLKTMTMPAGTSALDGARITFIILGVGDVKLLRNGTQTMINATHVSITGTQQYSSITLEYVHATGIWAVVSVNGSWGEI